MPAPAQIALIGLDFQELSRFVQSHGEPDYRARQLFEAIYAQRLSDLESISTLPKNFRATLKRAGVELGLPRIEKSFPSVDGTIRYLVALADGESVETVWMPDGDGGESADGSEAGDDLSTPGFDRATLCVSSQVGCAVNCQFCLTAQLGVKR